MASKRQLEGKVEEINKSLDDKEEATQYITQAMTRQYEAMQEQLVDKVPPPPPSILMRLQRGLHITGRVGRGP